MLLYHSTIQVIECILFCLISTTTGHNPVRHIRNRLRNSGFKFKKWYTRKTGGVYFYMKSMRKSMKLISDARNRRRFSEPIPEAILPELPFSWNQLPHFDLKNSKPFADVILAQQKLPPKPAYAWSESIDYYTNRAITTSEVVPLVDLIREVRSVPSHHTHPLLAWQVYGISSNNINLNYPLDFNQRVILRIRFGSSAFTRSHSAKTRRTFS